MLDGVRVLLTLIAFMGIGLHLVLMSRVIAHREMFQLWGLITAYAFVAAATLGAAAARRLTDRFNDQPFHGGDLLGPIPIIGFFVVGIYGAWTVGRHIGSIESMRKIDKVTQNVTHLDIRRLA
jgi:hypothetical protein